MAHASRNQSPRLPLALSLELVRTLSFQLFLKFCQRVLKLIALPGQDLEVHQTLVPHSATRLLLI